MITVRLILITCSTYFLILKLMFSSGESYIVITSTTGEEFGRAKHGMLNKPDTHVERSPSLFDSREGSAEMLLSSRQEELGEVYGC